KKFKATPIFKDIPLIILTTSSAREDMEYAYREGADKFLIKPSTVQGLNTVVSTIIDHV
ncbi:MAG: response regulator, partial [Flavipsychrobacter sp.]|nr:response regulator [Flavipsychrobacter sp.]